MVKTMVACNRPWTAMVSFCENIVLQRRKYVSKILTAAFSATDKEGGRRGHSIHIGTPPEAKP